MPVWTPKPAAPRVVQRAGAPYSWFDFAAPRRTFASDSGDLGDLMGRTAAGVRVGNAAFADGPRGKRLVMAPAGNDTYAAFAARATDFDAFSVSFRFEIPPGAVGGGLFQWAVNSPGNAVPFLLIQYNGGGIQSYFGNSYHFLVGLDQGTPHEYCVTADGTTWSVYLDGISLGSSTQGWDASRPNASTILLGNGYPTSAACRLDDFRIHRRALTASEVARDYNDPTWRLRAPVSTFLLSAAAPATNPATGLITLARVGVSGSGGSTNPAAGSVSLVRLAVAGVGTSTNSGSGSIAVGKAAVAGTGLATNPAAGSIALGRLAVAGTAAGTNPAAGSISLRRLGVAGAATAANSGAGAITLSRVQVGSTPPAPAVPLLFEVELETWLIATLGRPAWPGMIPQGKAGTCLVYTLVSTNSELNLDGPDGLREWHLQFDAWGKTRLEAITLIERLRLALEGYAGPMGRAVVENATLETEGDDFAPPVNASDRPAHRRRAEYTIFFRDGLST